MSAADRYELLQDGQWRKLQWPHLNQCCDCGLVHTIDYRINREGNFEVRYRRNRRATDAARRARKRAAKVGVTP